MTAILMSELMLLGLWGELKNQTAVNYLIGDESLDNLIEKTEIENLDILTSGPIPPNPSELLISEETSTMFEILKEKYDYILIDTPPVGLVADALELFEYSDVIIYVIRQNYTQRKMPKMIDSKYKNGEIQNVCFVLNDFRVKNKYGEGGYGYGYGYGYGKYGNGYHKDGKLTWKERIRRKLFSRS